MLREEVFLKLCAGFVVYVDDAEPLSNFTDTELMAELAKRLDAK